MTIAADGSGEPVVVTGSFGVSNWNPVWSPDGAFLYFVSDKSGNLNFWRVSIDQSSGMVLSEPEPVITPSKYSRHLNFSKDGRRMIYVQTDTESNIRGIEFDSMGERTVGEAKWITTGDREMVRAELSPDGTRFVMRLTRRTQDDIGVVDRNGIKWLDITNDSEYDRYPRWSRDGKQIAFASDRNKGYEIWICNADGTNLRQVSFNYAHEFGSSFPNWSPDGRSIIYSNGWVPYIVDITKSWDEQGGAQTVLPDPKTEFIAWDWSPDGRKLVGMLPQDARKMAVYSFDTKQLETIVENVNVVPSWLPDSRRFVYTNDNIVYIADSVTKKVKVLMEGHPDNVRSPFVSSDGKLLYYTVGKSESNIWLLDLDMERAK